MEETIITIAYLRAHPDHVFVFGDNSIRKGKRGAALMRDEPNSYGFITKKYPSFAADAYYKPSEYRGIFAKEMDKLLCAIEGSPEKTFLISQIGSGLADRFGIWKKVIEPNIGKLLDFPNVKFLFEYKK